MIHARAAIVTVTILAFGMGFAAIADGADGRPTRMVQHEVRSII